MLPKSRKKHLRSPRTFPCIAHQLGDAIAAISDDSFGKQYLSREFLSRYANPSGDVAQKRRDLTVEKLLSREASTRKTNALLWDITLNPEGNPVHTILDRARSMLRDLFGPFSFGVFAHGQFSNGATTSRGRQHGHAAFKFDGRGDVTYSAYSYALSYIRCVPVLERLVCAHWIETGSFPIRVVEGNSVFTVPKNDTIDRAAAKEPDWNVFLQRAVGLHIRGRLRKLGIDLQDQSRNQRLARKGSVDGSLATLDLSAASDSISCSLVRLLLPREWYDVLVDLRSPRGVLPDGTLHEWEMFSSMGNGFTFELETAIFYCLTRAVCWFLGVKGEVGCYGDDMICPTEASGLLIQILQVCGFSVNEEKSFTEGPFRESCGAHWYNGLDVKPFYARGPIDSELRAIWFCNSLRRWATVGDSCDPRYYALWCAVRDRVSPSVWGSSNPDDDGAVYGPGSGTKRWVQRMAHSRPGRGGYVLALHTTRNRSDEPWFSSDSSGLLHLNTPPDAISIASDGQMRLTQNVHRNANIPLFPQEVGVEFVDP